MPARPRVGGHARRDADRYAGGHARRDADRYAGGHARGTSWDCLAGGDSTQRPPHASATQRGLDQGRTVMLTRRAPNTPERRRPGCRSSHVGAVA
jgi:hypothetical protein